MTVDLELLRREAEHVKAEWDTSVIIYAKDAYQHAPDGQSNPGAVAERGIALIEEVEAVRRFYGARGAGTGSDTFYECARDYEARFRQLAEEKANLLAEVERLRKHGEHECPACGFDHTETSRERHTGPELAAKIRAFNGQK